MRRRHHAEINSRRRPVRKRRDSKPATGETQSSVVAKIAHSDAAPLTFHPLLPPFRPSPSPPSSPLPLVSLSPPGAAFDTGPAREIIPAGKIGRSHPGRASGASKTGRSASSTSRLNVPQAFREAFVSFESTRARDHVGTEDVQVEGASGGRGYASRTSSTEVTARFLWMKNSRYYRAASLCQQLSR